VATGASVSKLTAVLGPDAGSAADSVPVSTSSAAACRLTGPSARLPAEPEGDGEAMAAGAARRAPLAGVTGGGTVTEPGSRFTHQGRAGFTSTCTCSRSRALARPPGCSRTASGCRSPCPAGRPLPSTTCTSQLPNV
jgi:hypothetical protein